MYDKPTMSMAACSILASLAVAPTAVAVPAIQAAWPDPAVTGWQTQRACSGLADGSTCVLRRADQVVAGTCQTDSLAQHEILSCLPGGSEMDLPYPIVDTGQTRCYADHGAEIPCPRPGDLFAGQDAEHAGRGAAYADNGDGTVTDLVTELMWQQSPDSDGDGTIDLSDEMTFDEAQPYCETLELGGYDDWRLPDIKTLYSLIDFNGVDPDPESWDPTGLRPFIDDSVFTFAYGDVAAGERIIDAQYASSSLYVSDNANHGRTLFGVNFADGRIKGYGLSAHGREKTFSVICVRGNTGYGVNAFFDNGDGTVTDFATGLMWTQADSGSYVPDGLDWQQALDLVEMANSVAYRGHSDWRLPNAKELQSIVDYSRSPDTSDSAAIDPVFQASPIINEAGARDFPYYWTSTTHIAWTEPPGTRAVYVAFGRGLGFIDGQWVDVHGAGAQRSDPKLGDPDQFPTGHGPQGDAIGIYNDIRLVRDAELDQAALAPLGNPQ